MSNHRSPWLTLTTILVYCFLYLPIVVLVVFAFNSSRQNVVFESVVNRDPCGPFYWFCRVFQNQDALDASISTLKIAVTSTVIATIIGTMAALALQRHHFKLKLFAETSLYIPIVIPEIVMGIGILVLFNALFKFINTTFDLAPAQRLGLGLGTVIVSHVAFSVPFVALTVRTRLHSFDHSVEEAAADLGANEWTTFRRVTLPLILPGVLAGAMLAFTLSLDDFIITFFTNGPGSTTLPIYVYGLLRRTVTPEVNALSTMWILVVLMALFVSNRVQRRTA